MNLPDESFRFGMRKAEADVVMRLNVISSQDTPNVKCSKCGYMWKYKGIGKVYATCPSCTRKVKLVITNSDVNKWHQHCVKCNYDWVSRKESPVQCPQCKSLKWKGV